MRKDYKRGLENPRVKWSHRNYNKYMIRRICSYCILVHWTKDA
jgi:hypothetical protein